VRWTDPRGRISYTYPVDHLGVRECRVLTFRGEELALLRGDGSLSDQGDSAALGPISTTDPPTPVSTTVPPTPIPTTDPPTATPTGVHQTTTPTETTAPTAGDLSEAASRGEVRLAIWMEHEMAALRARYPTHRPRHRRHRDRPPRRLVNTGRDLDRIRWAVDHGHLESVEDGLDALDAMDAYLGSDRPLADAPLSPANIEQARSLLRLSRRPRSLLCGPEFYARWRRGPHHPILVSFEGPVFQSHERQARRNGRPPY